MTDEQLAEYLNIPVDLVGKSDAGKRETYERMAEVEIEIGLWQAGIAPKPEGVIVCGSRQVKP